MAIPIPHEEIKESKSPFEKMRKNMQQAKSESGKRILQSTGKQITRYLEEGGLSKLAEQELLNNLHRSILYIQKNKK